MKKQMPESEWTILKILKWTTSYFTNNGIDSSRITAEILLAYILSVQRIDLYLRYDQPLSQSELSDYKNVIKRRIAKEPVAYIVGAKEFWSLEFNVSPSVLIPRPDTETLVEQALLLLPKKNNAAGMSVFEAGTGSGAIITSLAAERPDGKFCASDKSTSAVRCAKKNAEKNNQHILFLVGDWFSPVKKNNQFDIILSNPPYIPTSDIADLQPEINRYEPLQALDGGQDGLDCIAQIINNATFFLKQGGFLLIEIGYDQKQDVKTIVKKNNSYYEAEFIKDYAGHDRVAKIKNR